MRSVLKINKLNFLSFFLIVLVCNLSISCQSIANKINGESKSKTENLTSLKEFISETKLKVDPEKQLYLLDESSRLFLLKIKANNPGKKLSIPNCYLFDKDFKLLNDNLLGGCITDRPKIEGKDFYEEVIKANENLPSNHSLTDWKGYFVDYKHQDYFPFEKNGRAKAVIAWAKFKGKMWADQVNYMIYQLQQSKAPIDIYILNLDHYQQQ